MSEVENTQERGEFTSASNAPADALCAGRHLAQRGLAKPEGTEEAEWADTGSKIHAALHAENGDALEPDEYSTFESCQKIEQDVLATVFGEEVRNLKAVPVREKRFWGKFGPEGYPHSGQPDTVYRRGDTALITDYKTLSGSVQDSEINMQLRDLAVLVWLNTPLLAKIAVAIIQPLATHKPVVTLYKAEDIQRAAAEMAQRITNSNTPDAPRVAGELQCKYCLAKHGCDAYAKGHAAMVPSAAGILDIPVAQWTPDQRAVFCNNKARAMKWIEDCEKEMKKLLEVDPQAIPGWCLSPGDERESVKDPQGVFDRFSELGGDLPQFMSTLKITKGELKKVVSTVTKLKGKALDKTMDKLFDGLTEKKQNAPSLARVKGAK